MPDPLILALIEGIGIGSCFYSLLFQTVATGGRSFFICGFLSTACGISNFVISTLPYNFGHFLPDFLYTLHYSFASTALILGYPSMVYEAWMVHYAHPPLTDFLGLILSLVLLVVSIGPNTDGWTLWSSDTGTKVAVGFALAFHVIISLLFWNVWDLISAGTMAVVLIALYLPAPGYLGVSAEDLYFTGLSAAFAAFSYGFEEAAGNLP